MNLPREAPWPEQMRRANAPLSDDHRRELEALRHTWQTAPTQAERHAALTAWLAAAERQVAR